MARIKIGNIKGPQGPIGPTGPQGPRGETGPQGPLPPLTNNGLATVAGVSALDAAYGKTLTEKDAELQKQIDTTNSNFGGLKFWSAESLKTLGLSLQEATTSDIYAALPNSSLVFCNYEPNSALMSEMGNNNGGAMILFKETNWRGFGYATCIQSGMDFGRIGHITALNKLEWIKIGN